MEKRRQLNEIQYDTVIETVDIPTSQCRISLIYQNEQWIWGRREGTTGVGQWDKRKWAILVEGD